MLPRVFDLASKAWQYTLAVLEQPTEIPFVIRAVVVGRAHVGEILRLTKYKKWIELMDIHTVLDIGAHSGEFSSALRKVIPDAYIYAFEPTNECFLGLKKRMRKEGGFKAFNVALGEREGHVEFYKSEFSKSSSVLPMGRRHREEFPWTARTEKVSVALRRLDSVLSGRNLVPNVLMKIDVQGYELQVLKGSWETLKKVAYIIVETSFERLYEGASTFDEVYSFLKEQGFRYVGSWDQLVSRRDRRVLQQDAIFVKE